MSNRDQAFASAVEAAVADTASYATKPEFRAEWLGITSRSRDYIAQQLRTFGELLEPVRNTLAGWKVLDVGCGDGRWLRRMVEFDARLEDVVGVDVSDLRFDIARKKNPLIRLIKIDGANLPFEDGTFDLVTEFVCFSHIPSRELRRHVAGEISRVLKPGGYMFWWDQPHTDSPADPGTPLDPGDYFDWPIRRINVGRHPRPSETLRPFHGRRFVGRLLDALSHPPTHVAALMGPKP
jgi:SAM-dependent methyltransferase